MLVHEVRKLKNGGTFVLDPTFRGEGASVAVLVKTGSRNEHGNEHGISHFLEHMVFKGSKKRSAMDLTLAFGDLGAQVNAYTSDEQTVFYGTVLNENVNTLHDILIDMMMPTLDLEEFTVEKKVILEEIALYEDRPSFVLYERAVQDFFAGEGVGQSVLGTTETVGAISRDEMRAYVERRYAAPNMIVSLCGDLDPAAFVALSEERMVGIPTEFVDDAPKSKARIPGDELRFHHKKTTQAHILGLASGPSATEASRYAALLLTLIIGDSQNSRLYWELVDSGLAEYASFDHEDKDGVGVWMLNIASSPEHWEEVRDKALRVLGAVRSGITAEELERAKTKALSRLVMDSELPLGKTMANALSLQYRGEPFVLAEEMERIRSVTKAGCEELVEAYPFEAPQLYIMLPE